VVDVAANLSLDADVLKLGFNNYPGHDVLDGWLDEVRIYNRALSQEEINDDMNLCHPEGFDDTLHSLAGVVGGNLQEGIKLELSGDHIETTYADRLGRFSFSDLASGDYFITPHYENCAFTPSSHQVKLENLNLNQIAFEASYTGNQSLGIKLWESYLGENSYCSGTCILSDEKIFQATFDGSLYCLNKEDGKILWKHTVNPEIPSLIPMNTIVDGNRVYLVSSALYDPTIKMYGELYSLDIEDGSLIWKKVMGQIEGWPSIYNDSLYVGDCSGKFYCLNKETGAEVWSYQFGNGGSSNWMQSSQAIYRGKVYFPNSTGNVYCLDAITGEELWSSTALGSSFVNLPTLSKGRLYIGGGNDRKLHCLDANSGEEVWSYNTGGPMNGSATVDGYKVFFGIIGHVYCLDAEMGKEVWTFKTEGNIYNKSMGSNLLAFNPPTIVNGKAYVWAWDNCMYCLNAETGEKIWSYALVEHRMFPAMISEGKVFTGDSKRVYCLNAGSDEVGEWLMFHKNLHRTGCTSVLSGQVMDENGDPLANVKIEVKGEENLVEASTNNRGYYELADLAEGVYTVGAIKEGYKKASEQVTLNPLTPIDDLDFTLQPSVCPVTFALREDSREGDLTILRRFRDEVLTKTPEGQEVIKLYYQWGPMIVDVMEKDEEFKKDITETIDGVLELITEETE
jgi:outer membrane protein assembly factor BamB